MGRDKMNAIVMANALIYTSPNADSKKAQQTWERFLDSFTWDKATDKANKPNPINMLRKLGVPIVSK